MTGLPSSIFAGGVRIDPQRHLFMVEITPVDEQTSTERLVFLDLLVALDCIGQRKAKLIFLVTAGGNSSDDIALATIEEVFKSEDEKTYLFKCNNSSTILRHPTNATAAEFEAFHRIYPPSHPPTEGALTCAQPSL